MAEESNDDGAPPASPPPGSPPPTASDPTPPAPTLPVTRRLVTRFSAIAALVFMLGWIVPISYVGSAGRDIRWMPREMRHLQRVACLFTRSVRSWGTYHIELRFEGSRKWVELPLEGYFDMSIFGYRTRFHRLIGKSYRRRGGATRTWYLARWIARRYAAKNPDAPKITGVRFSQGVRPVKDLVKEKGRFRKIAIKDLPPNRRRTVAVLGERKLWSDTPPRSVRPPKRRKRKRKRKAPTRVQPRKQAPIKAPGVVPDVRPPTLHSPSGRPVEVRRDVQLIKPPAAEQPPGQPPAASPPDDPPRPTAPSATQAGGER